MHHIDAMKHVSEDKYALNTAFVGFLYLKLQLHLFVDVRLHGFPFNLSLS